MTSRMDIARKAVTARRVLRYADRVISARLNALLGVAVTVEAVESIINDFFDRDLPTFAYYILRKAGIPIAPPEPLTPAGISTAIARKTGVNFRDVTNVQMVREDIDAHLRGVIYQHTGLALQDFSRESVISAARGLLLDMVAGRAPGALVAAKFAMQARKVSRDAFREGGLNQLKRPWSEHLQRWNHREAQRRYGAEHSEIWVVDDLGVSRGRGRFKRRVKQKTLRTAWKFNCKQWRKVIKGRPSKPIRRFSDPAIQIKARVSIRGNPRSLVSRAEAHRRWKKKQNWPSSQ